MATERNSSAVTPNYSGLAAHEFFPLVYDQLRGIARQRMALERAAGVGHTLQPTAVVHEAFARLARDPDAQWRERREFFAAAAREMERVLVDHARAKFADKRGGDPMVGGSVRIPLDILELARSTDAGGAATVALHEALLRLEKEDEQAAAVVRLRFFAGLSSPEAARALGVSERTVVRNWTFARAFLAAELGAGDSDGQGETGGAEPA